MHYFEVPVGKEERTARDLRRRFPELVFSVPTRLFHIRNSDTATLFPGLVFVEPAPVPEDGEQPADPLARLQKIHPLKPVSDQELRRVQLLEKKELSAVAWDGRKARFLSGPLMGFEPFVSNVDSAHQNVQIRMKLLGVLRNIWIHCRVEAVAAEKKPPARRVIHAQTGIQVYQSRTSWQTPEKSASQGPKPARPAEIEPVQPAGAIQAPEPAAALAEPAEAPKIEKEDETMPTKRTTQAPEKNLKEIKAAYTDEQKRAVIRRAEEIGFRKAAEETGLAWQTIAQWKKRMPPEPGKGEEAPVAGAMEPIQGVMAEVAAMPADPAKKEKAPAKKDGEKKEKAPEKKADGSANPGVDIAAYEQAIRENATLREQVKALTAQVEKLKKAIADLAE